MVIVHSDGIVKPGARWHLGFVFDLSWRSTSVVFNTYRDRGRWVPRRTVAWGEPSPPAERFGSSSPPVAGMGTAAPRPGTH